MDPKGKQSKKRQAVAAVESNDSSDEESSSDDLDVSGDDDVGNVEHINVEFEAQSPVDADFHGIRQLLLRVFLMLHVDVSELTDIIIQQTAIGSTIKIADDEDSEVYGIVSLISLQKNQEKTCVKELQKELLSKCKSLAPDHYTKLQQTLNNKNVGFVINERFINIPAQIAVPFHNSLWEEVNEAKSEEKLYDFDYLLLLSKTLRPSSIEIPIKNDGSSSKSKKKMKKITAESTAVEYTNFEDELFFKESELSFSYNVTGSTGLAVGGSWDFKDQTMNSYRTVMLVRKSKWKNILKEIETMVD